MADAQTAIVGTTGGPAPEERSLGGVGVGEGVGAGVGVGIRVGAGAMPQAWGGFGHSLAIWPSWRQLQHSPGIGQSLAMWAPRQMSHSTGWPTYQHFTLRLPMLRFHGMAFSLTIWTIRVPVETAGAPG